ncbi:YceD family protein [Vacuolonema iberomarrocanum]|uniref:YceD family protein n=1 Tax=Vacuolonema iberomarrocanum TaxID=3454632 RepID=UPI0019DD3097|nr:DUF177 domain-containing protein [filamentous cyanobacterium LEGE 07170]
MARIYIPQLIHAPDRTERFDIKEYLPDLETLTPVQGFVEVSHRGNFLEVEGKAETIMTMVCDRCLQQFNARLAVKMSEFIWLQESLDSLDDRGEVELTADELVESLPPNGYFEPESWLYEQFCLEIPPRKLCDTDCPGIELERDDKPEAVPPVEVDERWAALQSLKNQLSN